MHRLFWCPCLIFPAVLLAASEPSWKGKPFTLWKADDGSQVLADSPWVKHARVTILPVRGEVQLREGGKMGGSGKRAGLGKVAAPPATLDVRWESAAPVRTAELTATDNAASHWHGDFYAIAVYGVPGIPRVNQKSLEGELKQSAFLKRPGKRDLRLVRVEIAALGSNGARILYLFPRTPGITLDDQSVEFVSQIGRMCLGSSFTIADMILQGRLEL